MSEPSGSAVLADMQLDVRQRLTQLAEWRAAWQKEDAFLAGQAQDLDPERPQDLQRGVRPGLRQGD